jgi:hypothetical protein
MEEKTLEKTQEKQRAFLSKIFPCSQREEVIKNEEIL